VTLLANQAMLALGGMEDPETKRRIVDLDVAKHQIDSLSMLEEKTKGNLSPDEERYMKSALHDLRMRFVEAAGAKPEAAEPDGAPAPDAKPDAPGDGEKA
jgi:hypothetical protein